MKLVLRKVTKVSIVMHRPEVKYPTRVLGPASCDGPLRSAVVRIVLGNPRHGTPVFRWKPGGLFSERHHLWIECVAKVAENSEPQKGCYPIAQNCDIPNLLLNFSAETLGQFELSFSVFRTATADITSERLCQAHVAVLGIELNDFIGVLERPIMQGNRQVVGTFTFGYLVVKPFLMPVGSFRHQEEAAQKKSLSTLSTFTGHRGMGKTSPNRLKENSVFSFLEATRSEYVSHIELDVQLTKDGFPVVYHDWFFRTHGRDMDSTGSSLPVSIYNLTRGELDGLYTSGIRTEEFLRPSISQLENCLGPISADADVQGFLARDKIRTLAEVCMCLPEDIGIMVEVKYPAPNVQKESDINFPERNEIVDRVLHDLFSIESNSRRSIIFLSFEPDICVMLSMKQNRYPVFFSNCDGRDRPCEDLDPRCISFAQGIEFAASQKFAGILFYEDILFKNPEALPMSKQRGLSVLTYGSRNSDPSWAAEQIDAGLDSIIADDIHGLVDEAIPKVRRHFDSEKVKLEPRREVGNVEELLNFDHAKRPPFHSFAL